MNGDKRSGMRFFSLVYSKSIEIRYCLANFFFILFIFGHANRRYSRRGASVCNTNDIKTVEAYDYQGNNCIQTHIENIENEHISNEIFHTQCERPNEISK